MWPPLGLANTARLSTSKLERPVKCADFLEHSLALFVTGSYMSCCHLRDTCGPVKDFLEQNGCCLFSLSSEV